MCFSHELLMSLRYNNSSDTLRVAFPELRLLGKLYNGFDTFWDNLARGENPLAALLNFENRNYKLCILQMC